MKYINPAYGLNSGEASTDDDALHAHTVQATSPRSMPGTLVFKRPKGGRRQWLRAVGLSVGVVLAAVALGLVLVKGGEESCAGPADSETPAIGNQYATRADMDALNRTLTWCD